jgi:Family of unknown function (DUF6152)
MKTKTAFLTGLLFAIVLAAVPALAHHSFSMFDMDKDVAYKGTVVEFKWVNPHVHMTLQVDADSGDPSTVGTWDIEGASTNIMARQGWTKATFKAGDKITVVGHPLKDGSKGASMFYVILPDGKRLYQDIARPKTAQQ